MKRSESMKNIKNCLGKSLDERTPNIPQNTMHQTESGQNQPVAVPNDVTLEDILTPEVIKDSVNNQLINLLAGYEPFAVTFDPTVSEKFGLHYNRLIPQVNWYQKRIPQQGLYKVEDTQPYCAADGVREPSTLYPANDGTVKDAEATRYRNIDGHFDPRFWDAYQACCSFMNDAKNGILFLAREYICTKLIVDGLRQEGVSESDSVYIWQKTHLEQIKQEIADKAFRLDALEAHWSMLQPFRVADDTPNDVLLPFYNSIKKVFGSVDCAALDQYLEGNGKAAYQSVMQTLRNTQDPGDVSSLVKKAACDVMERWTKENELVREYNAAACELKLLVGAYQNSTQQSSYRQYRKWLAKSPELKNAGFNEDRKNKRRLIQQAIADAKKKDPNFKPLLSSFVRPFWESLGLKTDEAVFCGGKKVDSVNEMENRAKAAQNDIVGKLEQMSEEQLKEAWAEIPLLMQDCLLYVLSPQKQEVVLQDEVKKLLVKNPRHLRGNIERLKKLPDQMRKCILDGVVEGLLKGSSKELRDSRWKYPPEIQQHLLFWVVERFRTSLSRYGSVIGSVKKRYDTDSYVLKLPPDLQARGWEMFQQGQTQPRLKMPLSEGQKKCIREHEGLENQEKKILGDALKNAQNRETNGFSNQDDTRVQVNFTKTTEKVINRGIKALLDWNPQTNENLDYSKFLLSCFPEEKRLGLIKELPLEQQCSLSCVLPKRAVNRIQQKCREEQEQNLPDLSLSARAARENKRDGNIARENLRATEPETLQQDLEGAFQKFRKKMGNEGPVVSATARRVTSKQFMDDTLIRATQGIVFDYTKGRVITEVAAEEEAENACDPIQIDYGIETTLSLQADTKVTVQAGSIQSPSIRRRYLLKTKGPTPPPKNAKTFSDKELVISRKVRSVIGPTQ